MASTAEEVREILRNAIRNQERPSVSLGSRLAERFALFELDEDIPELRDHSPRSADFDS